MIGLIFLVIFIGTILWAASSLGRIPTSSSYESPVIVRGKILFSAMLLALPYHFLSLVLFTGQNIYSFSLAIYYVLICTGLSVGVAFVVSNFVVSRASKVALPFTIVYWFMFAEIVMDKLSISMSY